MTICYVMSKTDLDSFLFFSFLFFWFLSTVVNDYLHLFNGSRVSQYVRRTRLRACDGIPGDVNGALLRFPILVLYYGQWVIRYHSVIRLEISFVRLADVDDGDDGITGAHPQARSLARGLTPS